MNHQSKLTLCLSLTGLLFSMWHAPPGRAATSVVDSLSFTGQADPEQASFVLKGRLRGPGAEEQEPKLIYSLQSRVTAQIEPKAVLQTCELRARILQGRLKEVVLAVSGDGEITQVVGPELKDWSLRHGAPGQRFLVLRPQDLPTNAPPLTNFVVTVKTQQKLEKTPATATLMSLGPENAALFDGTLEVRPHETLEVTFDRLLGLAPLGSGSLTNAAAKEAPAVKNEPFRFRFSGETYSVGLQLSERDPDARKAAWEKFQMTGELSDQLASFVLTGEVVVRHPDGGRVAVLSGEAALTTCSADAEATYDQGQYWLRFRKPGTFPVELRFNARVTSKDGWNSVNFEAASSSLRPVTLKGLSADTQFQFPGAARPERRTGEYFSYLPSAGPLQMQWKEGRTEEASKLFYAVQGTAQIAIGPGLLRQAHVMEFKVMQGEISQLAFELSGQGEVTRVRGDDILAWKIEAPTADGRRRLLVQLNQSKKDVYMLVIQTQTPLGVFPLQVRPLRVSPVAAIRFGGHLQVINDGAVRLQVTEARGLSQVSPELFPKSKELAEQASPQRTQAFAYRFSGSDFDMAIQAENILPELAVSQLLLYHLGETEASIEAEVELDIREAPLREFTLRVPADFTVSRLTVAQLADYALGADPETGWARLKVVFASPLNGRQVLQLRLERNQTTAVGPWRLPVLQPQNVKSVRGYVGVSAETGFRLTVGQLAGLTEVASAFFPRKVAGLQAAYRLREEAWQATVNVERLALSIQADVVHLFTASEGIAYGSSVINYLVSGTPVSVLKLIVPEDYANLEFAGRDVRNWKKTGQGYEIYLNAPVFGTYTLLATYDRQFNVQSNVLALSGLRPADAQSEQGSVILVSESQFEVQPVEVSSGLLQLDPGEIPPEHRLLFDAPILAAYQYTARPFVLRLALRSLTLGETVHQVVDRAALNTRVSREGEVVTEGRFFLKSQGHSHLRLSLSKDWQLWETKVNGVRVVPVADREQTLIPLPTKSDARAVLMVELKMATQSPRKDTVKLEAPVLAVPVLLTEWKVTPDAGYGLRFKSGTLSPPVDAGSASGFGWLKWAIQGRMDEPTQYASWLLPALLLLGVGLMRWATREGVFRWSAPHLVGFALGALAWTAALACLFFLIVASAKQPVKLDPGLSLVAPIQEAGQPLTMVVGNSKVEQLGASLWQAWPALLGVGFWIWLLFRQPSERRQAGWLLGWTLICWGALRLPFGAPIFFVVLFGFCLVHLILPAWKWQRCLPRRERPPANPPAITPATALIIAALVMGASLGTARAAVEDQVVRSTVLSVVQQGRVQDAYVTVNARLKWRTEAGQRLDFLGAPAVLTRIEIPRGAIQLSESKVRGQPVHRLTAVEAGEYELEFDYQVGVPKGSATGSFGLPTPAGLVNRLDLEIERADVEVHSAAAVSVRTTRTKRQEVEITRAELVLVPGANATVGWRPRARDPRTEKPVFYGELYHLYIPTAGIVEGVHDVQVRPAQGQLAEISFGVPPQLTITDVQAEFVSSWRFDPDQHALRVQFSTPQARPFSVRLRSQFATSPLPYQQTNEVISLGQAAGQVGMVGVATGNEVQLDTVKEERLSVINLEDFPAGLIAELAKQTPGLTLRRAFRYADASARLTLAASAVQPDVRVETQETLSLSEDRTVLASQLGVRITRAGVFNLSFALPRDYEIESLSGAALSHWTELRATGERLITLHLRGKTEGNQAFNITLAGPGMGSRKEWEAPRLALREASKQTGQLVIVPELGMRLHAKTREGLTQLDPQKAGVQQKGVLAFHLLHARWQLVFEVETVEPWIQVSSLQDVTVREGQVQVIAQFEYQIENAGVKILPLRLPARAENVRFEGDLISDSARADAASEGWADWEVKLQRRAIGNYALRLTYQLSVTNQAAELRIRGIRARNANLHRGYLAVRSGGRLQVQFPPLPAVLQRTEWQAIPASLRRGRDLTESKDAFSTLENDFELPLTLVRHEIAKVLPARVEGLELSSVIAASGEMLTEGRLSLRPGDKRLIRLKLPASAQFWYAFVNGQSAWPWREGSEILLLLERNSDTNKATVVEFFYTCSTAAQRVKGFTHQLPGPAFDLPLENITWQVYVPREWRLADWESTLQLRSEAETVVPSTFNLEAYMRSEVQRQQDASKEAEGLLLMGNDFLQKGTPQQARRAYQSAWKMSPQDAALNEDARVQLHNLKMQQALLGLNQRRQAAFEYQAKRETKAPRLQFEALAPGQAPDYTQQQAQQVLEQNPAEENAALTRLAERLIRQQDATAGKPEAIRAALPTQGRQLTFTGSLQVQSLAELKVKLDARPQATVGGWRNLGVLAGIFILLAVLAVLGRRAARA